MSIVDITPAVEFEFVFGSGTWTDVSSLYIDSLSNVQWQRGVGEDRSPQTSTASFNLDNATEVWTPGNSSSSFYNKLKKGIGVRISHTYSATKRVAFRGVVTEVVHEQPEYAPARMRVGVECEGISTLLAADEAYGMAAQENKDVDDCLTAIMTAAGSTLYSFEDSNLTLPVVIPRADPLRDLVAVALSEPASALFESGAGLMTWKKAESMTGGHGSPAHTWGSTIAPEGGVRPNYRYDAQFARQRVRRSALTVSTAPVELYRYPFSWANKTSEAMAAYEQRRIAGTFAKFPATVEKKFIQVIQSFASSGVSLYAAIDDVQTYLYTSEGSFNQFAVGGTIRIDSEIMLITQASVANSSTTNQRLDVTRGYLGTVAAYHTAPASPKKIIYHRPMTPSAGVGVGRIDRALTTTTTGFRVQSPVGANDNSMLIFGALYRVDSELMTCTSAGTSFSNATFTRGSFGSTKAAHALNATMFIVTLQAPGDITAATYVKASETADTAPSSSDLIGVTAFVGGDHIKVDGNKFVGVIYNQSAAVRYNAELVIGGTEWVAADTPTEIVYEKAIPYIQGKPEGPARALPFGTSSIEVAKGWAMGLLRAGRIPSPWMEVTLTANVSDNVTSALTAEIGDLVRYTGTGTNREKIDEWFRIVGVAGRVTEDAQIVFTFRLAPSHLNRDASKCWYTDFSSKVATGAGLGGFLIKGTSGAVWSNDSQWYVQPTSAAGTPGFANAPGVAAPAAGRLNVGSADMIVGVSVELGNLANNSYVANTGGVGVTFRMNSGGTQFWEARFNPTQSKIYLWNTTDGVVGTPADWTTTQRPEIEVWAQGDRIRVFVDCDPQPVIDVPSTRFNTNTYMGPCLERTILGGGGSQPYILDLYAQAV